MARMGMEAQAGDCECRPRPRVQRTCVCACRQRTEMPIQHGRTRNLEGECVRRMAVEIVEIRGVYLYAYDSISEAGQSIMQYMDW